MGGDYEERVRRAIEAFNTGDWEPLREICSARLRIVPLRAALEDTTYEGPTAIDQFWKATHQSWSEMRLEIDKIESRGDRVLARGVFRGTARVSGAPVKTAATFGFTFRDGLVEEIDTRAEA